MLTLTLSLRVNPSFVVDLFELGSEPDMAELARALKGCVLVGFGLKVSVSVNIRLSLRFRPGVLPSSWGVDLKLRLQLGSGLGRVRLGLGEWVNQLGLGLGKEGQWVVQFS